MLNKLLRLIAEYHMLIPGDKVCCAVSGGADSMALLWSMYLLREKLGIKLSAVHYNHNLRGEESDQEERFVADFCQRYDIPLSVGRGKISAGKKGLEAAAREARYAYFQTVPGKIATAHTANDNAETVLMHMVRGSGLKGLGGISPVRDNLIRPMLGVTRQEVLAFLAEYHIPYCNDSSNHTDAFLRNRLRHHVIPLLEQENPRLAENMSAMALRLREDELTLRSLDVPAEELSVPALRNLPKARRSRLLAAFLEQCGVKEPESEHISLAEQLVFSEKPSARASFPGDVAVCRNYDILRRDSRSMPLQMRILACPGITRIPELGLRVVCRQTDVPVNSDTVFSVLPVGQMVLRGRETGDILTLPGGSKPLKKLFIDRKIPAADRCRIPVVCDTEGILGVYGFGVNRKREVNSGSCICIEFVHDSHSL